MLTGESMELKIIAKRRGVEKEEGGTHKSAMIDRGRDEDFGMRKERSGLEHPFAS